MPILRDYFLNLFPKKSLPPGDRTKLNGVKLRGDFLRQGLGLRAVKEANFLRSSDCRFHGGTRSGHRNGGGGGRGMRRRALDEAKAIRLNRPVLRILKALDLPPHLNSPPAVIGRGFRKRKRGKGMLGFGRIEGVREDVVEVVGGGRGVKGSSSRHRRPSPRLCCSSEVRQRWRWRSLYAQDKVVVILLLLCLFILRIAPLAYISERFSLLTFRKYTFFLTRFLQVPFTI